MANIPEEALLALAVKNKGGGGGTSNYEDLENKPQIAGNTLSGNKSLADLGIASAQSVSNITNGESINNFAGVETALGNKQGKLTAGDYIDITNDEISVDREIPSVIAEYEIKTEPMVSGQAFISITKTVNGEVVLTQKYGSSTAGINQGINFDENIYVDYSKTASWSWTYKLRNASVDHAANYTQSWNYGSTVDYTEEFYVTDHSGDKLVIKSEMDAALDDKADKADVKNEFVGTLAEWNALSPAQQKAFDTYQITDDYSEALVPNYSTVEQKTGQKWIDGKDIYSKTVDCGMLPDNTSKLVAAGLNNVTVIKIEGVAIGGSSIPLPHISINSVYIEISYEASNDVFIRTNGYFSTMHSYVTLYYTKTT